MDSIDNAWTAAMEVKDGIEAGTVKANRDDLKDAVKKAVLGYKTMMLDV